MAITIETPNITALSDREQLQQIRSYLYQMAGQLQWAFSTLETGGSGSLQTLPQTGSSGASSREDPQVTFAALKNLIIKSADIVESYYDTISARLKGVYVAQSDFGIYAEKTGLELEGNAKNITQLYTNEQTIVADLNNLSGSLSGQLRDMNQNLDQLYQQTLLTNAYIQSGLICYRDDGTPVYGLEIGQTNSVDGKTVFHKFARFTADRLSFFDSNDVEVAYISDYRLCITNAEITGTLWLSEKFRIYHKNGLVFQWIGGEA